MSALAPRLLLDASVALAWEMPAEPHAAQAREMLLDWDQGIISLCTTDQFTPEITNALLTAFRRGRLTRDEALDAVRNLLALRLPVSRTTARIALRAFEIAERHNQRVYDCIYVAVAERRRWEFWTGDQRLYNALQPHYPFVRWIAHYQRRRP